MVGSDNVAEADFGLTAAAFGSITGEVWNDVNRNGIHDAGEPPLVAQIYLDINKDGQFSPRLEPTATSDSQGLFSFENVLPGPERIGLVADEQLVQTSPVDDRELDVAVPIGGSVAAGEFLAYVKPSWLHPDPGAVWSLTSSVLTVSAGTVHIGDASSTDPELTVTIAAGATLVLDANQHLGSLAISMGGHVDLSTFAMATGYFSGEAGPPAAWNGSNYTGFASQVSDGTIFSSHAVRDLTTVGLAQASDVLGIAGKETAVWKGHVVNEFSILLGFTYVGDANLDGRVNIDDYGRIDANVGQSGTVFGWYNGDFNFDGKINIDDYGLIDSIIGAQGPVL